MVTSKKNAMMRAAAIAMSLTMLTSALSVGASAATIYSSGSASSSDNESRDYDIGPAIIAFPLAEGVLHITTGNTTGSWTQHWIETYPAGTMAADELYVLTQTEVECGIEYTVTDPSGKVVQKWTEEYSYPTGGVLESGVEELTEEEAERRASALRKDYAAVGEIDNELGYQLLDALYEEQTVLTKAVKFYKELSTSRKDSAKGAANVKIKLSAALSNAQKGDLTDYINNCNKEASYFARRASALKGMLNQTNTEIKRLTKALDNITKKYGSGNEKEYFIPVYDGLCEKIDPSTTRISNDGYFAFWNSYHIGNALGVDTSSGMYYISGKPIVGISGDMALLLSLCNNPGKPYDLMNSNGDIVYVAYIGGKVYNVDANGKKLSKIEAFDISDTVKHILARYNLNSSSAALNASLEEELVYETAVDFYKTKSEEIKEIVSLLKKYKNDNSKTLSSTNKAKLTAYINAYSSSASYFTRRRNSYTSMSKTATAEAKRLSKLLEITGDSSGKTGDFGFWKTALTEGRFAPTYMYTS